MASLMHLVRHAAVRNVAVNNLLAESPTACTSYSEYVPNTPVSVDLSSLMYSPEIHKIPPTRSGYISTADTPKNIYQKSAVCCPISTTIKGVNVCQASSVSRSNSNTTTEVSIMSSLSQVSTMNGAFDDEPRGRKFEPVNSTFNHNSCVKILDFTEISVEKLSVNDINAVSCQRKVPSSVHYSSTGYSSNYSRSTSKFDLPAASHSSSILSDSGLFEKADIGRRPECIGKEASPKGKDNHIILRNVHFHSNVSHSNEMSVISVESDTSSFMTIPLFRQGISNGESKGSNKLFARRFKQFKKHLRQFGKTSRHNILKTK